MKQISEILQKCEQIDGKKEKQVYFVRKILHLTKTYLFIFKFIIAKTTKHKQNNIFK